MSKNEGGLGQNEGGRMTVNLPPQVTLKKLDRSKVAPPSIPMDPDVQKSGAEVHLSPGSNKRSHQIFSASDNKKELENYFDAQKRHFSETQIGMEFSASFQYDDRQENCEQNAEMDVESLYMKGEEKNEYFQAIGNGGEDSDMDSKGESSEKVGFDSDEEITRNDEAQQQNPEDDDSGEENEGNFYQDHYQELNGKLQEVHDNSEQEEFLEEDPQDNSDTMSSVKLESFEQVVLINNKKYFKLIDSQDLTSELHKSFPIADIQQNIQAYTVKMAEKVQEISAELKLFHDFKIEAIALMEKAKLDAQISLESIRTKRIGAQKHAQSLLANGGGLSGLLNAANDYSNITPKKNI
ncbi:hypothetical protein HK100_011311 [Physocladia obscura]|uniref:Uncharacterized protein n=1 Tax=Physocladia obscura TaxID=109957 RepID=A0AAD5T1J7_9FUNG|nr:hypothetical protein HK100_011311 [Physocladia obscura]